MVINTYNMFINDATRSIVQPKSNKLPQCRNDIHKFDANAIKAEKITNIGNIFDIDSEFSSRLFDAILYENIYGVVQIR